ncbi:cell wall-binding repeat-containing protein [Peptostreptococcus stomatis]|uniref:cell wall-binding repeat-containing protein n=1 Tax=Peptostreptococcus stomatis TaxID=341694 RepID=UPI003FA16EFD
MKKQIAVLMAAATAVTTVAPVIANADVNEHKDTAISTVVDKAKKALAERYTDKKVDGLGNSYANDVDEVLNSRYIVLVDKAGQGFKAVNASVYKDKKFSFEYGGATISEASANWYVVDSAVKLANLLEANPTAKVAIYDKGISNGAAFKTTTKKHYVAKEAGKDEKTQASLEKLITDLVNLAKANSADTKPTFVQRVKVGDRVLVEDKVKTTAVAPADYDTVELKLASGENLTFKVSSTVVDLEKPMTKDGQLITGTNNAQNVLDTVAKFEEVANEDNKSVNVDIPSGDVDVYLVSDAEKATIKLENVFTKEGGYTEKGADFVNNLINFNKLALDTDTARFNFGGYNYETTKKQVVDAVKAGKIAKTADGYELTLGVIDVKDVNDNGITKKIQFVIKGKTQADLNTVLVDLGKNIDVVAGHFTKLSGVDRYATAIEVSREQFEKGKADTVVIVGGQAKFDGLSAAPLAASVNAPILLASPKTGLNQATLDEIGRVTKDLSKKTVFIVGGENSVPASVEKQLKDKFGVTVVRLAGLDRTATSMEVARRLKYDGHNGTTAFFVGANGAADAMSVSAVAARVNGGKVSPIVVMKKDGFDKATREYLGTMGLNKAYIVGGTDSVSSLGYNAVKYINGVYNPVTKVSDLSRISGADRYATNVEVINSFYKNPEAPTQPEAKGAIFASGANQYLVDAQTSGAYAAFKESPIVLAGSKMTADQSALFKKNAALDGKKAVVQVGGVVAADFMKAVVEKLGL